MRGSALVGSVLAALAMFGCARPRAGRPCARELASEAGAPVSAATATERAAPPLADAGLSTADALAIGSREAGADASADAAVVLAPSRLVAPPGPCVDPTRDARARLGLPSLGDDFFERRPTDDLDGDGVADWFVNAGADAADYHVLVYLARGACGHFVGRLSAGASASPSGKISEGLLDLESPSLCRRDCCDETTWTRWAFDGRAYRAKGTRVEHDDCAGAARFE